MNVSQSLFHAALRDPAQPVPEGLTDGVGRAAGRRFAVYRNNVAASLIEALELSFPAIARLIGADNFRKLAHQFIQVHPPTVPMLSRYGAEMSEFLATFKPLKHLGYLPDVARLEQAIRLSYHAADAAPIDPTALQSLVPHALAGARLDLAPALVVIRSPWPIHAIRAFNLEDGPKPQDRAENVLVTRPDFDPMLEVISDSEADFLALIEARTPLGEAHDITTRKDVKFDLSRLFGLLLKGQAITRIRLEHSS